MIADNAAARAAAVGLQADGAARPAEAPFVRIENISKRFAARRPWKELIKAPFATTYVQALTGVSLSIERGEFFGLLGQNGAGKTTLFKILATLIIPDSGRAIVDGWDSAEDVAEVRKRLVPVVADERSLRWRLDARENLRLYAVLYRVPRAEVSKRIERVLEIVDLANTGARMVGQFSSGMKQRLLIARALLAEPRVLLLDEPTRGLDPVSARGLRSFLKEEVCRRQGCTIVLATHNAEEALHLCDRVAVLHKGRALMAGEVDRLLDIFADDRYQVWTRSSGEAAIRLLAGTGGVADPTVRRTEPGGWSVLEMRIPGGYDASARVLEAAVSGGVEVARFERVQLSLGDLIERVQQHAAEGSHA